MKVFAAALIATAAFAVKLQEDGPPPKMPKPEDVTEKQIDAAIDELMGASEEDLIALCEELGEEDCGELMKLMPGSGSDSEGSGSGSGSGSGEDEELAQESGEGSYEHPSDLDEKDVKAIEKELDLPSDLELELAQKSGSPDYSDV